MIDNVKKFTKKGENEMKIKNGVYMYQNLYQYVF